jgi:hypothetical protein
MYGYAFAAAKADVWHHHYPALQAYPPGPPDGEHAESDLPRGRSLCSITAVPRNVRTPCTRHNCAILPLLR